MAVFGGAFSQDVAFSGPGTLELAHSLRGAYCGTITGFGGGDALVLDDLAFSQCEYAVWCNNILTIYDGERPLRLSNSSATTAKTVLPS